MTLKTMPDTSPNNLPTLPSMIASLAARLHGRYFFIGLTGVLILAVVTAAPDPGGLILVIAGAALVLAAAFGPSNRARTPEPAAAPSPIPSGMRRAFEASGAGAWSWRLDDGSIRVNRNFERLAGIEPGSPDLHFSKSRCHVQLH